MFNYCSNDADSRCLLSVQTKPSIKEKNVYIYVGMGFKKVDGIRMIMQLIQILKNYKLVNHIHTFSGNNYTYKITKKTNDSAEQINTQTNTRNVEEHKEKLP